MRHTLRMILIAAATLLLSACALQPPAPKTLLVSGERLTQMISSQFPFNSEMLEVLDVDVSTPRVALDPLNNRINTAFDLDVAGNGLVGMLTKKAYHGGIDLSYGLRFEPRDGTVRLTDVHVRRLAIDDAPDALRRPIEKLGAPLAQRLLKDYVVYRIRPEDLQAAQGWGYAPGAFRIVPEGLTITLEPVKLK